MKRMLTILLAICMLLSTLCMTASAETEHLAGDVNFDGKVTPYDALLVQAYLHGERSLTNEQIQAAIASCPSISTLSSAHIVSIFFKPLLGQNEIAPEEDGLFHIRSASDMALFNSFPYGGFSLDEDIDMTGVEWTPVLFSGVLFGNGHTISNLTVKAPENNVNAGALFVKVGSAGSRMASVSNLTLVNPKLTTSSVHTYAGLVCGTNYGNIQNISILGGQILGSINENEKFAGAEAGINYGTVASSRRIECNIAYTANTMKFVGTTQSGGSTSHTGDYGFTMNGVTALDIENRDPVLLDRQVVVDAMYSYTQVPWLVKNKQSVKESDVTFSVNSYRSYVGLPYSHALGSMDAYYDAIVGTYGGTPVLTDAYTVYRPNDTATYTQSLFLGHIVGMDCSSAVLSAWRTVCTNATAQNTSGLVPTAANIASYGLAKIGIYDIPTKSSPSKSVSGVPDYSTAWDVNYKTNKDLPASERNYLYCSVVSNDDGSINEEKLNNLYEAYAICLPGDAIDCSTYGHINSDGSMRSAGHARLVSQMPVVVRDVNGKIDPANSYLTTIEQGGGGGGINSKSGRGENGNKYSSWGVNIRYSFRDLAGIENATATSPNYACYVPLTCTELLNTYRQPTQFKLVNSTSPYSGIVSSNYGIVYTEVTIDSKTDKQFTGRILTGQDAPYEGRDESGYTAYKSGVNLNRVIMKSVNLEKHAAAFSELASGKHTYSITVKLTTGESKTYSGTYTK